MTQRSALITGGSGQDGWYLTQYLLAAGYDVHLQSRSRPEASNDLPGARWHIGDLKETNFLNRLIEESRPDEIYNLAAVSTPLISWQYPVETGMLNAIVPHKICEIIRRSAPSVRLFQASSSEMFGVSACETQDESSALNPRSPYGIAKTYAHQIVTSYRSQFGLHFSTGILFNHESPRRPLHFVSQKIAYSAACVSLGVFNSSEKDERGLPILEQGRVKLGNLDTRRDFGFAGDYVEAMHAIVQGVTGDDYVIGTGETHSIADFCRTAFQLIGRDWRDHVVIDPNLVRKADGHTKASPLKLKALLGHEFKTNFAGLVSLMVQAQIEKLKTSLL